MDVVILVHLYFLEENFPQFIILNNYLILSFESSFQNMNIINKYVISFTSKTNKLTCQKDRYTIV